jgi:hypothetical protein
VVQVSRNPAHEHARHTHGPVAALEQIDAQRDITLRREPAADVLDVVVQPRGLMEGHQARKRLSGITEARYDLPSDHSSRAGRRGPAGPAVAIVRCTM